MNDVLAPAIAHIGREFSRNPAISLKLRARQVWELGLNHPRMVARYRGRAQVFRAECPTVDHALRLVEHWYREEKRALSTELAIKLGRIRSRIHFEIISELRLLLRLMRRKDPEHYRGYLSTLFSDIDRLEAAE